MSVSATSATAKYVLCVLSPCNITSQHCYMRELHMEISCTCAAWFSRLAWGWVPMFASTHHVRSSLVLRCSTHGQPQPRDSMFSQATQTMYNTLVPKGRCDNTVAMGLVHCARSLVLLAARPYLALMCWHVTKGPYHVPKKGRSLYGSYTTTMLLVRLPLEATTDGLYCLTCPVTLNVYPAP